MKKNALLKKLLFAGIVLLVAGSVLVVALSELDTTMQTEEVTFRNGNSVLAGILSRPATPGPYPAIVFIHGDGPMNRDSGGYFPLLWKEFTRHGFACLAWDKPGVGESSGDWLAQSMRDRAIEALAAIEFLQSRPDIRSGAIGFWGGSQAGWVMPLAASMSEDVAFIISMSGAISWERQHYFHMQQVWRHEGFSPEKIRQGIEECLKPGTRVLRESESYESYQQQFPEACASYQYDATSTAERWAFDKTNIGADARPALRRTRCPLLAIFGEHDAHVDVHESMAVYKEELAAAGNDDVTIRLFPDADHILVTSRTVKPGNVWTGIKLALLGKAAFATRYLETMTEWLETHAHTKQ